MSLLRSLCRSSSVRSSLVYSAVAGNRILTDPLRSQAFSTIPRCSTSPLSKRAFLDCRSSFGIGMATGSIRTFSVDVSRYPDINLSASSSKAASNCSEIFSYMGGLDIEQKQMIKKLVHFKMREGKRTRVRAIVYQTFRRLSRTEGDVIKLMVDAVENIKPICKVEKVRVAGTSYDVPGIVGRDRQQTLAIRWILEGAFKRRINNRISLEKCLFDEILDAYRKRGIARKKRENLHGLASANRSFAHFRWW